MAVIMDDNVAFLSADVGRLFRKRFELATRDLGITGPQWRVLARIADRPGMNQMALASLLEVEAITIARQIDRLEKLGLVERRADPGDRRAWLLHLTPKAEPVMVGLRERAAAVIAEVTSIFNEPERAQLVSLLQRLRVKLLDPTNETAEVAVNG